MRTDHIGDIVVSFPLLDALRHFFPKAKITLCVQPQFVSVASLSKAIDKVYPVSPDVPMMRQWFVDAQVDCVLHLHYLESSAKAAYLAKVAHRIGRINRVKQWRYCNRFVFLSAKKKQGASSHEAVRTLDYLKALRVKHVDAPDFIKRHRLLLSHATPLPEDIASALEKPSCHVVLHPGSQGSGAEWPQDAFIELIKRCADLGACFWITGLASEAARFSKLLAFSDAKASVHCIMGRLSLPQLLTFLKTSDVLIASGTGPVHLAAGLGVRTIGLYPNHPIIGAKRWAPLGPHVMALSALEKQKELNERAGLIDGLSVERVEAALRASVKDCISTQRGSL